VHSHGPGWQTVSLSVCPIVHTSSRLTSDFSLSPTDPKQGGKRTLSLPFHPASFCIDLLWDCGLYNVLPRHEVDIEGHGCNRRHSSESIARANALLILDSESVAYHAPQPSPKPNANALLFDSYGRQLLPSVPDAAYFAPDISTYCNAIDTSYFVTSPGLVSARKLTVYSTTPRRRWLERRARC
jgi:hypothetical protein